MFTFSNFQLISNCQKLWHFEKQFFLLLDTACISLALPLSRLPFTHDTHMVCLQWHVLQCVHIWIFNISNTDSFKQPIYLWYKYYSKWICDSFSFQYIFLQPDSKPRHATRRQVNQRFRPLGHDALMMVVGLMSYTIVGYKFKNAMHAKYLANSRLFVA